MARAELEAFAAQQVAAGLVYTAEFVPLSKSRNAPKVAAGMKPRMSELSLNWRITLTKGGRTLTTDYMQGIGHAPGYKAVQYESMDEAEALRRTAERGKLSRVLPSVGVIVGTKELPAPDLHDILWSLSMDASAIDAGSFEEWASDCGEDADSRKAEAIYRACVEIGLKLRLILGDAGRALQEAGQDY